MSKSEGTSIYPPLLSNKDVNFEHYVKVMPHN